MSEPLGSEKESRDPLGMACELIGKYQYHFSQIERALNDGISKVLDLNDGAADIVTANLDFVKKLNIVRSVIKLQFDDRDGSAEELLRKILGINEPDRQTVIHSTFEPAEDGVRFRRIVAKAALKRAEVTWDKKQFEQRFLAMQAAVSDLRLLVERLQPYQPNLDFSDPRNSGYIALLSDI